MARYGNCDLCVVSNFSLTEIAEINCNGTTLVPIDQMKGVILTQELNDLLLPFLVTKKILSKKRIIFYFPNKKQMSAASSLSSVLNQTGGSITVTRAYRSLSMAFLELQQQLEG